MKLFTIAILLGLLKTKNGCKSFGPMVFFLCIFAYITDSISYFIRFVIDCGYVKQRQYNPSSGMYSLDVVQISR